MLDFEHFWKCTPEMYASLFRLLKKQLSTVGLRYEERGEEDRYA